MAGQTLDNLVVLSDAATIPVYRPLIGFDKADAIALAREIGTFEESTSHVTGCRAVRQGAACGDPGDRAGDEATGMPVPG